jgi:hypothetical protein
MFLPILAAAAFSSGNQPYLAEVLARVRGPPKVPRIENSRKLDQIVSIYSLAYGAQAIRAEPNFTV